jgi:hypothetical protein
MFMPNSSEKKSLKSAPPPRVEKWK